MATTKQTPVEPAMTDLQILNHALRRGLPVQTVVDRCRTLLDKSLTADATEGPARHNGTANMTDVAMALWTMAAQLAALSRENETLKRKLRRDNRRGNKGRPTPELLKKTPGQVSASSADMDLGVVQPEGWVNPT